MAGRAGWAAGFPGAAVSFAGMFLPSCFVIFAVAKFWERAEQSRWRAVVERALAPVAIGLTFAAGLALMRTTEDSWLQYAITLVGAALFAFTKLNAHGINLFNSNAVFTSNGSA